MPKVRLGVALLVPAPFDRDVDALRAAMGDPSLGRIPPHLTLVPPVNVRDDDLPQGLAVLRAAGAATRSFVVRLGPPASFLPVNPVLYLAVSGDLDAVHALRSRVFRPPLERTLTHPFVPHVTIADDAEPGRIEAALKAMADVRLTVTFDRVHLLQEGADRVWKPIAEVAFVAPAVVGRGSLPLELSTTAALDAEGQAFADREWPLFDADRYGTTGRPNPVVITARREGEVIGYAEGWTRGQHAHLNDLIVAAPHRGEGVGSHLLAAFESEVQVRGATAATLHTERGGPAEALYLARGWARRGAAGPWPWAEGREFVLLRRDFGP